MIHFSPIPWWWKWIPLSKEFEHLLIWCCCSLDRLCLTLCNPMVFRMPAFPVLHHLPELGQMSIELVLPSNHLILHHPFSSCLQSFPASRSFPMSQFFTSGGQSMTAEAGAVEQLLSLDCLFSPLFRHRLCPQCPTPRYMPHHQNAWGASCSSSFASTLSF